MGNSLHNKIQLGRSSPWTSRKLQAALGLGISLTVAVLWLTLANLH